MKSTRWMVRLLVPCLGAAGLAHGALFQYEGFNYVPGSSLDQQNGGTGWAGGWGTPGGLDATTVGGSLTSAGLVVSGGAVSTAGSQAPNQGSSVATWNRLLGTTQGTDNTTVYFSFLMQPNAGFGFYGGLNLSSVFVGLSGNQSFYGLEGPGNDVSLSSVPVVAGQTVLFVLRVDFRPGNDTLSLYLNPLAGQPEPGVAALVKTNLNLGTVSSVTMNNYGGFTTDEIRIGSSFADVTPSAGVPEPACGWAVLLAAIVIVGARARA